MLLRCCSDGEQRTPINNEDNDRSNVVRGSNLRAFQPCFGTDCTDKPLENTEKQAVGADMCDMTAIFTIDATSFPVKTNLSKRGGMVRHYANDLGIIAASRCVRHGRIGEEEEADKADNNGVEGCESWADREAAIFTTGGVEDRPPE
jgi:hypothetical protein